MEPNNISQVGITRIGSPEANIPQDIQLVGSHIINEHCVFENNDGKPIDTRMNLINDPFAGEVKLLPCPEALCYVNGRKVFMTKINAMFSDDDKDMPSMIFLSR